MNILIKNADFSEVSIGKVDTSITLEKKSIITNSYLTDDAGISYISNGSRIFAVDVSSIVGKTVEIKGNMGSTHMLGVFHAGDCPTTNITFSSREDAVSFRNNMGEVTMLNYPDDPTGITTKNVVVPNGAKSLFVYVGASADIDELYVKYSLF